ncbi:M48 family metallopeptidase [Rhizobium sp. BK602]|uniref:M48 family metallopeptidase n=1 Tax=Rhizobium sp. BK602 TaxID=2586986 RepID=UPI001607A25F|nr:M48 family metallopeptidase [Rhizobium sp. BK602]MBB3609418.1 Zn-dependent protease with chaperone function [Rhizobium sp. BK602]
MASPLPSPREGRWRALLWLAFGDLFLLVCGCTLMLSPLLLALLVHSWLLSVLLAVPALSWVFYGLMVLRAYASVPPAPISNGILLEPGKVPALAEELERLRLACDAPAFTAVHINAELNAFIYQTGSRAGQPKHVLVLGLPLLALLTGKQAAAVIAHEYAHISRLHGHFARWAYMARQRWAALGELHERNHRLITAPLRVFLSWYVPRMMRETLEFSRRCEVVADAQAIEVCGADTVFETEVALALRQKAMSGQFWPDIFGQAGKNGIAEIQPFSQLLTEPANSRPHDEAQAAVWLHESLCQEPDIHSTHPVFFERVAATGFDRAGPLPDHLPWHLEGISAAVDWLQGEASGIAAQLDADWRENAVQGWQEAGDWHAHQCNEFSRLLRRREQQVFDEQDWLQLAQLAEKFDLTGTLRAEAIAEGLRYSPKDPALLRLRAGDLERGGDIHAAISIWQRIGQSASSSAYQAHRQLCELYLRVGDKAAEHHRQIADQLWTSEDARQSSAKGLHPHGMEASELALLQGTLQPLFQHARAIWLCRDTPAATPDPPRWFLYIQAYDSWFMRLAGKLTGEEDVNTAACKRLLERLRTRLHLHPEVRFIGPNDPVPAHCTQSSLITEAGSAAAPLIGHDENS